MTQEFSFDRTPDVQRGTVAALGVIPIGIVAYVALYQAGFVASVVGFGVAWLGAFFYQQGSGQRVMDRTAAVRIAIITLTTIIVAIAAAIVWDIAGYWADQSASSTIAVLFTGDFWGYLVYDLSDWEYFSPYLPDIGLGLLFGVIGSFSTLRAAFGRPARVKRD